VLSPGLLSLRVSAAMWAPACPLGPDLPTRQRNPRASRNIGTAIRGAYHRRARIREPGSALGTRGGAGRGLARAGCGRGVGVVRAGRGCGPGGAGPARAWAGRGVGHGAGRGRPDTKRPSAAASRNPGRRVVAIGTSNAPADAARATGASCVRFRAPRFPVGRPTDRSSAKWGVRPAIVAVRSPHPASRIALGCLTRNAIPPPGRRGD
jgi:hypothetical protein